MALIDKNNKFIEKQDIYFIVLLIMIVIFLVFVGMSIGILKVYFGHCADLQEIVFSNLK